MIRCTFENGSPAMLRHVVLHAVVERDGALLLVRRAERLSEGGKWGLPGGFLDRDETLAQGTLRELREETGWDGEVVALLPQFAAPPLEINAVYPSARHVSAKVRAFVEFLRAEFAAIPAFAEQ